ncbi:hypothetical protein [Mycoplasma parvum]|uniref:Uncharacterized protein n=1 Tax=Mycoplasma parvum str. Indiana TaxID=1403316 RepID=U5NFG6_9MOLU|nr:hypothetical protein [Mycoplasma parvum]AGX88884.1 hypothetical protein PRV_00575 [Mycoplasma parvum str. Indiana]
MKKLSESEKKQIVGGAGRRRISPFSSAKSKINTYNTKLHNISLLSLSAIPGIISLGEEIYSLFANRKNYSVGKISSRFFNPSGISNSQDNYINSNSNSRRDFYAYASEAFRPMIRFSPYYYKSGISFGIPWMV